MMTLIDTTHDPARKSWVPGADGHPDFPIQNLPLGIFSHKGDAPRGGIAIGDYILDLKALAASGLVADEALRSAEAADAPSLNTLFARGGKARKALRLAVSDLLMADSIYRDKTAACLVKASEATLHLPFRIGDYTDFYVGIHHAVHVGSLFRPDHPLLPNYKHVPIGYHGRASSITISGKNIRRPNGQTRLPDQNEPVFGPCRKLDYELELGVWTAASNKPGEPIPIDQADAHIGGYCLLNDWSARDIQAWEYQPLGPFLAKNFATTLSPWVITPEALAPFRMAQPPRPAGDPEPLPYLSDDNDRKNGALDLSIKVFIRSEKMRNAGISPHCLAVSGTRYMYWTVAQMIAHHTCNGCNLQPGDLLGTGTLSGPDRQSCGSMLEMTDNGQKPVILPSGEERRFLEDGDEITLVARSESDFHASIGFGECRAIIEAAPEYRRRKTEK